MTVQDCSCDVIRDLIPLVRDEVACEASRALVLGHVRRCPECGEELGKIQPVLIPADNFVLKKIRQTLFLRLAAFVILGVALGLLLRVDASFLYNLLIMPVVGAALYLFGGKRWFLGACAVAAVGMACQILALPLTRQVLSLWPTVGLSALIGAAYGLLVLLGGGIAALFKYAFAKESTRDEKTEN